MLFSAEKLGGHYQRLLRSAPNEWRGVWARYAPGDKGQLVAQPLQIAKCAFKEKDCKIEQTNVYYEGLDVSKVAREATHPPLSEESFSAITQRNMIMLVPTENTLLWSTLDFSAAASGGPEAAVEFVLRWRSERARLVLRYGAPTVADGDAGGAASELELKGLVSIRDSCQAETVTAAPARVGEAGVEHFAARAPATERGWIQEWNKVAVLGEGGQWEEQLPETSGWEELPVTLSESLGDKYAAARDDLPEPDMLAVAPSRLSLSDAGAAHTLTLAWAASRDVCLTLSASISSAGKLHSVSHAYLKNVHWKQ